MVGLDLSLVYLYSRFGQTQRLERRKQTVNPLLPAIIATTGVIIIALVFMYFDRHQPQRTKSHRQR